MRLRALPEPDATRNRAVDGLRVLAVLVVVVAHWLVTGVTYADGRFGGESVLVSIDWAHAVTWVAQVMPVFFAVGGYANAASWGSALRRGLPWSAWVAGRAQRLLRPTSVFVVLGAAAVVVAGLAGVDPAFVELAGWVSAIALWFLAVYLAVVALAPLAVVAQQRYGLGAVVALVAAVAVVDLLGIGLGWSGVRLANYLLGWLALHQVGVAWRAGAFADVRRRWALCLGGLAAGLLLVVAGPYPVSMVGVPGEPLTNTGPPTLALLAVGCAQVGGALLLERPLERLLRRPRAWALVAVPGAVLMTLFLWHMAALVVAAVALLPTGLFPQPPIGSATWLVLRPLWLVACAIPLVVLVALLGRFERPRTGGSASPAPEAAPSAPRTGLVVVGLGAACAGLSATTIGGLAGDGPLGLSGGALGTYAVGAVLLALSRRVDSHHARRTGAAQGLHALPGAS